MYNGVLVKTQIAVFKRMLAEKHSSSLGEDLQ